MSVAQEREYFPDMESSSSTARGQPATAEDVERYESTSSTQAHRRPSHLNVNTFGPTLDGKRSSDTLKSPSQTREQAFRFDDDLKMLQVERQVDARVTDDTASNIRRTRSGRPIGEPVDEFDVATNPIHETAQAYRPPDQPSNKFAAFLIRIHKSTFLIRYFLYITPLVLIMLVPLLVGSLVPNAKGTSVGGIKLMWFMIWLEVVWLTLWAARIFAKCFPWPAGLIASIFTSNSKKWRDMMRQLEMGITLFFWWMAILISFLPIITWHHVNPDLNGQIPHWAVILNKVIISGFVFFTLNLIAKILIQLIAISFHLRTYADRIELNNFQINSLVKLYQFSKVKIAMEDSEFEAPSGGPGSGAMTPGALVEKAQKTTKQVMNTVGDVAGKVAGDFTGKKVTSSTHPRQVTLSLLSSNGGSQVLARRLYRTFARPETETVVNEDLTNAFEDKDEAEAAFAMFDKDMNGDITMEELEAVCMEIGRERKSITASLKDLDSVVSRLDSVFLFIVFVIWAIVLLSIISTQTSGVLTSLGSVVLGLSWLFSATAQEFLQSLIFVFVKHPFDVGDRVSIYGNTGSQLKGDDYFVKEISLLYTEFKKMEGQIVQAPNSYLNTLFILNQRRSGGLAEAIPMTFKYGTTLEQIEGLRSKLMEFVKAERREYQSNILTELREIVEVHYITVNIVFFYKTNWQNELVRLQRRNKFHCAMMVAMQELDIQGPRMRYPGQQESFPVFVNHLSAPQMSGRWGNPDNPSGMGPPSYNDAQSTHTVDHAGEGSTGVDIARTGSQRGGELRRRGESMSAMARRLDFSLGMDSITEAPGDVWEDRENSQPRVPISVTSPSPAPRKSDASAPRVSRDIGPGNLARTGTSASVVSHPNRFFGRRSADVERKGDPESQV